MTLHEAMVEVLRERGGWTERDDLAREIARRDLYRQRAGGHAPSDQLRLRARKYDHLFEGSDDAYTRIRLRSSAGAIARARRSSRAASRKPLTAAPATVSPREALAARRRRAQAARRFKPQRVKLLLVAEAPPQALDRYFYFDDVAEQDALFRYVVRGILECEPSRAGKAALLGKLRERGVLLIDLKEDPLDGSPLGDAVPDLVRRASRLDPEKIILIKATVYDAAFHALRESGLPVVNERVPFPGSGQQRNFEAAFARALMKRPQYPRGG